MVTDEYGNLVAPDTMYPSLTLVAISLDRCDWSPETSDDFNVETDDGGLIAIVHRETGWRSYYDEIRDMLDLGRWFLQLQNGARLVFNIEGILPVNDIPHTDSPRMGESDNEDDDDDDDTLLVEYTHVRAA